MRPIVVAAIFTGLVAVDAIAQDSLIAAGSSVTKLASGFRFTEGPAVASNGDVAFTDIPNRRILRWSTKGVLTTLREDSGGANGLFYDRDGNLLCCEGRARRVTSVDRAGQVTVLADAFDGKKLNSPNDLWLDRAGGIYFTDPRYGRKEGLEQGGFHVYYLAADRKRLTRVTDDLLMPNGIVGTADGKTLYVADTGANKTYAYRIGAEGRLEARRVFANRGSDGMTVDARGNVYLTGAGVTVFDPAGKAIEKIAVAERTSNVVFGGADRDTLFITARTSLYSLRMTVSGQRSSD